MSKDPKTRGIVPIDPVSGMDVPWLLRARATSHANRPFLIWAPPGRPAQTWTYADFAQVVRRVATGLAERGVVSGDRVIVHLPNCPAFLFAWHAASLLGAVSVTTSPSASSDELTYYGEISRPRAAITSAELHETVADALGGLDWIAVADTHAETSRRARQGRHLPFSALVSRDRAPDREVNTGLLNNVQFTSGTTSRPKGVMWTHGNAIWGAKSTSASLRLTSSDVTLLYFPLHHTNAMMYGHLATLWSGGTIVLVPGFRADDFWPKALEHRCTWTSTSSFVLHALSKQPVPATHAFRFWGTGATDIAVCRTRYGVKSLGWWAMTETVALALVGDVDLPAAAMSVGRPAPGYQVAIQRDDSEGAGFPETGRLLVRGTSGVSMFAGYLSTEASVNALGPDGWFDTGDLATLLSTGEVRFDGRAKDALKVGGENVASAEIERVVATVTGVAEVAVVGRPDPLLDEVPVAFVIAASDPTDLAGRVLGACRQALAPFKVPRDVIVVDELPRSTAGKIAKRELRRRWPAK